MAIAKRASARANLSADILAYRRVQYGPEVLLVHPVGPYWRKKDDGAWSIPKGEIDASEDSEQAARREFAGSGGLHRPVASLGRDPPARGKSVIASCGEADFDTASLVSNSFEIEWPPESGRIAAFPEVDRAAWFDLDTDRCKILSGQTELLDRLEKGLAR